MNQAQYIVKKYKLNFNLDINIEELKQENQNTKESCKTTIGLRRKNRVFEN